jgi:hypothetical protein
VAGGRIVRRATRPTEPRDVAAEWILPPRPRGVRDRAAARLDGVVVARVTEATWAQLGAALVAGRGAARRYAERHEQGEGVGSTRVGSERAHGHWVATSQERCPSLGAVTQGGNDPDNTTPSVGGVAAAASRGGNRAPYPAAPPLTSVSGWVLGLLARRACPPGYLRDTLRTTELPARS